NKQHSPLLRLPAELRNKIYKHVLGGHEIYARVENAPFTSRKIWREQHGLCKAIRALPRTSAQLRHETALLVYKYNTFRVRSYDLDFFFDVVGESAARALRHLVIEHCSVLLNTSYRRLYDVYRHGSLAHIEVLIRTGRDGGYLAEVQKRLEQGFGGTGCARDIEVVVGEGEMVIC
ncbi:hypothetical protein C7974DRAFT_306512, partial [Boeremia exigua]|uniref:uncharacterized protein n=1 Tax=Boeremia exigua TaxID=749465 RepID=UPI001E8CC391